MCGRYSLHAPAEEIARVFSLSQADNGLLCDVGPRYNIAPATPVLAVRQSKEGGEREPAWFRWGLIPHWLKETGKGPLLINARGETVAEKQAFRTSFRHRRCLVIADGFFEWQVLHGRKQPHHFQIDNGALFAFAGIWDRWDGGNGDSVESCAIITTRANDPVSLVHDRMPVVLSRDSWDMWLHQYQDDRTLKETLRALMIPFARDRMVGFPVSTIVNSSKNDVSACVEPVGPALSMGDVS